MNIYLYMKTTDSIQSIKEVLKGLRTSKDEVYLATENRRSFREYNKIKHKAKANDLVIIDNITSLGLSKENISDELNWFINTSVMLAIKDMPATYEYGVSQPANKTALSMIMQLSLNTAPTVIDTSNLKQLNSGRAKIEFPENWEELYKKWSEKLITSAQFIEESGLKRATFYNMLAEWNAQQDELTEFGAEFKTV